MSKFPIPSIYEEISSAWTSLYDEICRPADERGDFTDFIMGQETEALIETRSGLQPWLGIFEFGIEWLSYVHVALSESLKESDNRPDHLAAWALVGSAVSFGLSIRRLCISGFDTPARALLRSYVETLLLCLAILDDEALAQIYVSAADDIEVKNFWHTSASPKNLHARIIRIEKKRGAPEDAIDALKAWRREEYEILSQSSHLSYTAATLTARPPRLGEPKEHVVGIFGVASSLSRRTVSYACGATWHFSRFCHDYLIGHDQSKSLLILDRSDEWQRKMVIAREVLSEVTLAHWAEMGRGPDETTS